MQAEYVEFSLAIIAKYPEMLLRNPLGHP